MHSGVILIVKAQNRKEALKAADAFLEPYGGDRVWDWYQIGGRWTGTLTGYDPEKDPRNHETCSQCDGTGFRRDALGNEERAKDPTYTCNGCGTFDVDKKVWSHGPLDPGKSVKWPTEWVEVDDNAMPLSDKRVRKVVRDWTKDWKKERLAEITKMMRHWKKDEHMTGYLLKKKGEVLADDFSFESKVFDTERWTNSPPRTSVGYWAVMIDMHH
jgi:hypothetical protein